MRKKKYLHTNFLKFLVESERQTQDEIEDDEVQDEIEELDADEVIDEIEELDADEVIERMVQNHKKLKKEYNDIVYGRKRK